MFEPQNATQLLNILSQKPFIVYGHGYTAKKFYEAIKNNNLLYNFNGFVVSNSQESFDEQFQCKIYNKEWLKNNSDLLVCIAVHPSILKEILDNLNMTTDNLNCIFVYPYLYELLLNVPVEKNILVSTDKILKQMKNCYSIAVRYAAINAYMKKNYTGYSIYIKAISLHCDEHTAKKRLQRFIKIIEDCEKFGYNLNFPICVNNNYEVFDGMHRIALAKYFGIEQIYADLYKTNTSLVNIHNDNSILTRNSLIENNFTKHEMTLLDEINNQLLTTTK